MQSSRILSGFSVFALLAGTLSGTASCSPRATPRVQSVVWRSDDVNDTVLLRADVSYLDDGRVDELFQQVGDEAIRWIFDGEGERVDEVTVLRGDDAERHAFTWDGPRLAEVSSANAAFKRSREYTYWNQDARFIASIVSTETDVDGIVQNVLKNKFGYEGARLKHVSAELSVGDDVFEGGVDFDADKETRQLTRLAPDDESDVPAAVRPALTWDITRDDQGRLGSAVTLDETQRFDVNYGDDGLVEEVRIRQGERSSRVIFTYDEGEVRGLGFGLDAVFGLSCPVFPLFDLRGQSDGRLAADTFSGALGFLWAPFSNGPNETSEGAPPESEDMSESDDSVDPITLCEDVGVCWGSANTCIGQIDDLEQRCSGSSAIEAFSEILLCFRDGDTCSVDDCQSEYSNYATAYNETCI